MEILRNNNQGHSEGGNDLVSEMMKMIEAVGSYICFRKTQRKECLKLVRRLKLLLPLLEETNESIPIPTRAFQSFLTLNKALLSAKKLLKQCNFGSKIFLVSFSFNILKGYLCNYYVNILTLYLCYF